MEHHSAAAAEITVGYVQGQTVIRTLLLLYTLSHFQFQRHLRDWTQICLMRAYSYCVNVCSVIVNWLPYTPINAILLLTKLPSREAVASFTATAGSQKQF